MLVGALNGAFHGRATAESFNGRGKTDILVRSGSDNVFLAECKLYNGPNGIVDAIRQLLGYTTWRDRQPCLIVFVRSAAITHAKRALQTAAERIPHVDRLETLEACGAEMMLHGHVPDDPELPIEIRALLIHIKIPRASAKAIRSHKAMHPDDVAETLLRMSQAVPPNAGIVYTADLEEGSDQPVSGWSTKWWRSAPGGQSAGIRAVPTTLDALQEHGPEGALISADSESAVAAHGAIRRAQVDGVRAEIRDVSVRLDRIAGALRDAADRVERADPAHVTVVYGPRGLWQVSIAIVSEGREPTTAYMAFRLVDPPEDYDLRFQASMFDLAIAISVRRAGPDVRLDWSLGRLLGSADERLVALQFLFALCRGGLMQIKSIDPDFGELELPLDAEPRELLRELASELEGWESAAVLEAYCGVILPLPIRREDDRRWWRDVLVAAEVVRRRTVFLPLSAGSFVLALTAPRTPHVGEVIDVPVFANVEAPLLEHTVPLGLGSGRASVRVVSVMETAGEYSIGYVPIDDQPVEMTLREIDAEDSIAEAALAQLPRRDGPPLAEVCGHKDQGV